MSLGVCVSGLRGFWLFCWGCLGLLIFGVSLLVGIGLG